MELFSKRYKWDKSDSTYDKLGAYQHVRLAGSLEHPCVGHRLSHDVPPDSVDLV